MMRGLTRFFWVSAVLLTVSVPCFAGKAEDLMLKGARYVAEKDYGKALKAYQDAVAANPNNANANLLLGLAYANTADLSKAVQYTQASLKLAPGYHGYYNLGIIYANIQELDKSAEAFREALKQNNQSYQAWYQLGQVYHAKGDFNAALESYGRAVKFNPNFSDAYLGLGSAFYWSGNIDSAREQVQRLKAIKETTKAQALEEWIINKEAKKSGAPQPQPSAPMEASAATTPSKDTATRPSNP